MFITAAAPVAGSLPVMVHPVQTYCIRPCVSGVVTLFVSAAPRRNTWLPTGGSAVPCSDRISMVQTSKVVKRAVSGDQTAPASLLAMQR